MYIRMGMRARVKQYSIIVCTRKKKSKGRTKLEQEQIWNGFKGFQLDWHNRQEVSTTHHAYISTRSETEWNVK